MITARTGVYSLTATSFTDLAQTAFQCCQILIGTGNYTCVDLGAANAPLACMNTMLTKSGVTLDTEIGVITPFSVDLQRSSIAPNAAT